MLALLPFGKGFLISASKFYRLHWFLIYYEKGYIAANINIPICKLIQNFEDG